MTTHDDRRRILSDACPYWHSLRPSEQNDLIEGRCIYRHTEGVAILDYTQKHPFYFEGDAA